MFKVPEKQTEKRLVDWRKLRQSLEKSDTPFEDTANFFNQFSKIKVYTDPYDQSTWPTAWELIEENEYCPFNVILGICYTIQLCERFENITPKITITIDSNTSSVYYLLYIEDIVYGFEEEKWVNVNTLPNSLKNIKIYHMPPLH